MANIPNTGTYTGTTGINQSIPTTGINQVVDASRGNPWPTQGLGAQPYDTHDFQGQMVTVKMEMESYMFDSMGPDTIKEKMLKNLVIELMRQNLVEFTSQKRSFGEDIIKIRARIYALPDDHVRIVRLRTNNT